MARGFVMGAIWGTVVAGFGAAALSIAVGTPGNQPSPLPAVPQVDQPSALDAPEPAPAPKPAPAPEPAPVAVEQVQEPQSAPLTATEPAEAGTTPTETDQPEIRPAPESAVKLPGQAAPGLDAPQDPDQIGADTEPPTTPQIGEAPQEPAPANETQGSRVTVGADTPVTPAAPSEAPAIPAPEQELAIATEPAQPPAPEPVQQDAPPADEPAEDMAEDSQTAQTAPVAPELPQVTGDQSTDDQAIGLGTSAGTLINREPAVPQGRLPSIGNEEDSGESPVTAGAATSLPDDSPLVRFAAASDAAPDMPRMAIVLIDDGTGPLGPEALGAFPFPVTFAIDPGHPAPEQTAAAYRALGFEVMVLADVPEGAQASDVEVALAGALAAVPQAIGVLEDPLGGIQGSRDVSTQVTAYLAASGHGLVTLPKGLNTAQQLAAKEGVPSATLFRDFDGEGQDGRVIRRFLDQAAFRSRQEGAVIMLGRLRADTVSALVQWGLQDRATAIALVPVSLVLKESLGQ